MPAAPAPPPPGRFAHAGVLALTVVVFAIVVAVVTLQLRAGLREQILSKQAETLAAVASMQLDNIELDVPFALLSAALKTSKYPGVVGVRVFDAQGQFNSAWPLPWSEEPAPAAEWARVRAGATTARAHPDASAEEIIGMGPADRGLLEAWVPLRRTGSMTLIGGAQFWISGVELATHDRRLWLQAGSAWLLGSGVIVLALGWAFRRLDAANRELRARGEDLLRANRELVLAAKTSALGAVTAHLMHELKNPLAGLELIMAGQSESAPGTAPGAGGELAAASELTRRLRTMVNDVVGVLRDEQTGAEFELTCADVVQVAADKVRAEAKQRGVRLEAGGAEEVSLPARRANLATLVVRNLLQNALEASGDGGAVRLSGRALTDGSVEFVVEDAGDGLPAEVRRRLFQPCTSTKVGGSGLGLALSHQLAQQAGGRLELVRSDGRGTTFRLVLAAEA